MIARYNKCGMETTASCGESSAEVGGVGRNVAWEGGTDGGREGGRKGERDVSIESKQTSDFSSHHLLKVPGISKMENTRSSFS